MLMPPLLSIPHFLTILYACAFIIFGISRHTNSFACFLIALGTLANCSKGISDLFLKPKMQISGSKKQLKLQLKTGLGSSDGKEATELKEDLLKEGEVSDSESVTTVVPTESQKARRASPTTSPSKRLVEFVTVQGFMADYVACLSALQTTDPSNTLNQSRSNQEWDNFV